MKICPYCREDIKKGASKCPHCQSDLRKWFRRHPILTFLLIITISVFALNLYRTQNHIDTADTSAEEPENSVVGKHAFNKINGAYRGEILAVKNCENAPALMCYVVNQQSYMRPMEAPVDNTEVRNDAPTPTLAPASLVTEGTFMSYSYSIAKRDDAEEYAAGFTPSLERDDTVVIGAALEVINKVYGRHTVTNLRPSIVAKDGIDHFRFQAVDGSYYVMPVKDTDDKVQLMKFWKE